MEGDNACDQNTVMSACTMGEGVGFDAGSGIWRFIVLNVK
jgi:hypothetical protein